MTDTEVGPAAPVKRSRLVALAAVSAVVLVVAGVAVAAGRNGGSGHPALPLPASPQAGGPAGSQAGGPGLGAGQPTAAMAPAPGAGTTYQWQGKVPSLAAGAPAYRLDPKVDHAAVAALASALGLHASVLADESGWSVRQGTDVLHVTRSDGRWSYTTGISSCIGVATSPAAAGGVVCAAGAGSSVVQASGAGGGTATGTGLGVAGVAGVGETGGAGLGTTAGSGTPVPPAGDATTGSGSTANAPMVTTPVASGPAGAVAPLPGVIASPPGLVCPRPPCPAGMACSDLCVATPRVNDLLSADAAGREARDVLGRAGIDLTGAAVTARQEPWADLVSVNPGVGGFPTEGMGISLTIGAHGVIQTADGLLATPSKVGDYSLVGTSAAFARLQAGHALLWGGLGILSPVEPALGAPTPSLNQPAVRPVTITGAHLALVVVPGHLASYLEPAYVFETAGSVFTPAVAAVGDKDLQAITPPTPVKPGVPSRPAPVEPGVPTQPAPVEPGVPTQPAPVEPGVPTQPADPTQPAGIQPAVRIQAAVRIQPVYPTQPAGAGRAGSA